MVERARVLLSMKKRKSIRFAAKSNILSTLWPCFTRRVDMQWVWERCGNLEWWIGALQSSAWLPRWPTPTPHRCHRSSSSGAGETPRYHTSRCDTILTCGCDRYYGGRLVILPELMAFTGVKGIKYIMYRHRIVLLSHDRVKLSVSVWTESLDLRVDLRPSKWASGNDGGRFTRGRRATRVLSGC